MNSLTPEYLMDFLKGSFVLKRHISDSELTIVGEAEFYPESENTIVYYEHGNYLLDGALQEFYQKRYFIFEPGLLKICNSQGQVMHEIPLGSSPETECSFSHTHLCKKDEYLLDFSIVDSTIYMDYKVTGPHKNYLINTRLERKSV